MILTLSILGDYMIISFSPVDYSNIEHCKLVSKWQNDISIKHLTNPNFFELPLPEISPYDFFVEKDEIDDSHYSFFILANNEHIGEVSLLIDPEFLNKKIENSAWLSISIGSKKHRGIGIGEKAMSFIEDFAEKIGIDRIELGVFEFNVNAIKFYQKIGYQQFAYNNNFTYYNGSWHAELRFEKLLK